jgi:Tol biopolymer transport system component
MTLLLAALAFVHFRERPVETPMARLSIAPPENNHFAGATGTTPAVSPNGRFVVFEAISADGESQLWLRPLDSLTAQPLAGTENASYPFWSPDSKSIGFFAAGKLQKLSVSGGGAAVLADASNPRGGTWSQEGVIVFAGTPYGGLTAISESGGSPHPVIPGDPKKAVRFPWFLPDARHFLYLNGVSGEYSVKIGSIDSPAEDRTLPGAVDSPAVFAQGQLLFVRGTTLFATPFDAKKMVYTGDAVALAEHVQMRGPVAALARFSVSGNGVLIYGTGSTDVALAWLDRSGKRLGTLGGPVGFGGGLRVSPDGKTAAVSVVKPSGGASDIWLYDVARGLRMRFTFDPAFDSAPVWSPNGRTIVFRSNRNGNSVLSRKAADGSSNEDVLFAGNMGLAKTPGSFSPDGKYLAYSENGKTGQDIWILPDPLGQPGSAKPYPFLQTEFNESDAKFSPDGHWIAYMSNESGRNEVYVTPFPGPGGKRQISPAGGSAPLWRPDGKELYYIAADNRLTAAEIEAKVGAFEVKKVDALFGPLVSVSGGVTSGNAYDVSTDGRRFLAAIPPEGDSREPLTVVQNWTAGLKK